MCFTRLRLGTDTRKLGSGNRRPSELGRFSVSRPGKKTEMEDGPFFHSNCRPKSPSSESDINITGSALEAD